MWSIIMPGFYILHEASLTSKGNECTPTVGQFDTSGLVWQGSMRAITVLSGVARTLTWNCGHRGIGHKEKLVKSWMKPTEDNLIQ